MCGLVEALVSCVLRWQISFGSSFCNRITHRLDVPVAFGEEFDLVSLAAHGRVADTLQLRFAVRRQLVLIAVLLNPARLHQFVDDDA